MELVRSCGVEIVSSADLVSQFAATMTDEQYRSHIFAAEKLGQIVQSAFREIGRRLARGRGCWMGSAATHTSTD